MSAHGTLRRVTAATFVIVACTAAGANAAHPEAQSVHLQVEADGVFSFSGTADLVADLAGIWYSASPAADDGNLSMRLDDAVVRIVNRPIQITGSSRESPLGEQSQTVPLEERVLWEGPFSGHVARVLSGGAADYIVRAPSGKNIQAKVEGPVQILMEPPRTTGNTLRHGSLLDSNWQIGAVASDLTWSHETFLLQTQDADLLLLGGVFELRQGGDVTRVDTGKSLNRTETVEDPNGWAGRWVWDHVALEIHASTAALTLTNGAENRWNLAARSVSGDLDGALLIGKSHGDVTYAATPENGEWDAIEAIGHLSGGGELNAENGWNWDLNGDATFLAFNGNTYAGHRQLPFAPIIAAGGLLSLAGLIWFFRAFLSSALARVFLPLYSLLREDRLLDQPMRAAIHRAIQETEGISFEALRESIRSPTDKRIGNGTLLYHLRRLQEHDLIRSAQAEGRSVFFARGPGRDDVTAQELVLAGSTARALAIRIVEQPGLTHTELAASLGGSSVTARQRCRHHVQKLMAAGLVEQKSNGRHRIYTATVRLQELLDAREQTPNDPGRMLVREPATARPTA